jgi:glycosyltransferase involved in cell wall biosynthesis
VAPTERLRVLQVIEAFGGGALEVVTTVSEGLAERGDAVAIAYGVRPETPSDIHALVAPAVEVVPLPWTARTARAQLSAGRALRRLVDEWRPDLVHLHSSFAGVVGSLSLRGRVPLVYTPHAYSFTAAAHGRGRRALYRALERLVARRTDMVGAVSRDEERLAREVARARNVSCVPNGIPELDPGREPGRTAGTGAVAGGRPSVVAMGRIVPQRRPEACARILAAIGGTGDVAWLGGGGPHGPDAPGFRVLREAGIEITGWVDREQAMGRLASATAYLHWTAWDGQALSVLEAMARDVVVVASDIEANRELVGAEQVCREEADAVALLLAVMTDEEHRERLLESQRSRRGAYGAQRMVDEWRELYATIAHGGPAT